MISLGVIILALLFGQFPNNDKSWVFFILKIARVV